jgi:bifunctional enzyme CysN/CysC
MSDVIWHPGSTSRSDRAELTGGQGLTVWLTGLSGSGKSTVARRVEEHLIHRERRACYVLDGDNVRHGLNHDLGFSAEDRAENVRRLGEVARLMADAGLAVLAPVISPYRSDRDAVRAKHAGAGIPFYEVFVAAPLEVCEQRDPKGLYRRARAGEVHGFTGIDDPYEPPAAADLVLDTTELDAAAAAAAVVALILQS